MKTITIKVPEMGKQPGTLAWLAGILETAEIDIRTRKNGLPGLFWRTKEDGKESKWEFVVGVCDVASLSDPDTEFVYDVFELDGQHYKAVHTSESGNYRGYQAFDINAMFGTLTPAATKKAETFRQALIDAYVKAWESDGDDQAETLSVTVTL